MKTAIPISLALAILAAPSGLEGQVPQDTTPRARAEATLATMIAACRADDFALVARHVVYRGEDRARRWQDVTDPDDDAEMSGVRALCREMIEFDPEGAGYTVQGYQTATESEGVWHALMVEYVGSEREVVYAFLEIEGVFAIGDID